MKLVFILDPLEKLKSFKDTSLAIMHEASRRGHELFVSMQHDLFLRGAIARLNAKKSHLLNKVIYWIIFLNMHL